MSRFAILVGCATLVLLAATAARATECVGRCDGPDGAARVVSAGTCDASASCRAGCDASGPGAPRPYADCVSPDMQQPVPRPQVADPGGTRE